MSVRELPDGRRREQLPCGCATIFEPPADEGGPWSARPVATCGPHRRDRRQVETTKNPPEVNA